MNGNENENEGDKMGCDRMGEGMSWDERSRNEKKE